MIARTVIEAKPVPTQDDLELALARMLENFSVADVLTALANVVDDLENDE